MFNHFQKIQELTYQGDMSQALNYYGQIEVENENEPDQLDLSMLHANILHETSGTTDHGQAIVEHRRISETAYYLQARLLYLKNDHTNAAEIFRELSSCSKSVRIKSAALIGLACTELVDAVRVTIDHRMNEISELMPQCALPEKLAGMLFLSNYHSRVSKNQVCAMQLQNLVISTAIAKGWNYFIMRALYGLIESNSEANNKIAARGHFDLLSIYCKSLHQENLLSLAKNRFRSLLTDEASIEIDVQGLRIKMGRRWVKMHRKPLLLKFLAQVSQNAGGVSCKELASELWPGMRYQRLSIEARLYDLAKRAKNLLQTEGFGHIGISFRAGSCLLFYDR